MGLGHSPQALLSWFSAILVILFLCKAIAAIYINNVIISFSQNQQIRLRSSLMQSYQNLPYTVYLQRNSSEYIYSVQTLTGQFQRVPQQLLRTVSDTVTLAILGLLIWKNWLAFGLLVFWLEECCFSMTAFFAVE